MVSVGGGVALTLLVIVGVIFAERLWIRITCAAWLGVCVVAVASLALSRELEPQYFAVPSLFVMFAWFVWRVKRWSRTW